MAARYVVEHLNHLGIVAEVCREIGVAAWLDSHDPTSRQRVSVGTAPVALVLNGLGWSKRQLYLAPPTEQTLGRGDHDLPTIIEVTYGYLRDHRADLKQWMLALITSGEGVPECLHPLDGQTSDKPSLTSRRANPDRASQGQRGDAWSLRG